MRRVMIIRGPEKGLAGTVVIGPCPNKDDVLVNLDSVYGRVNSPWNRVLSFNEPSLRDI